MLNALTKTEHIVPKILRLGSAYGRPESLPKQQTVVVDYSSVNIGKPIHAGHLRATLFGHFICKINEFMGHKVIGINYIGDCGFQLGALLHGFELFGNDVSLRKHGIQHLYEVYTKVHKTEKKMIQDEVNNIMKGIERGDEKYSQILRAIKDISLDNLKKTYERMGVEFTEYQFESQFANDAKLLVNDVVKMKLAGKCEDGSVICKGFDEQSVTLLTKDGRSLYLSRDMAAAIQRHEKHNFDRIHYVVSNGQSIHFKNLSYILEKLGYNFRDQSEPWGLHIPFGTINSISTRKGNAVFLQDIMDHFQEKMIQRLKNNTRLTTEAEIRECADKLAWSFLVECLLKFPRMRPIPSNFYNVNDGVKLQYCHSRLCSLETVAAENEIKPVCNDEYIKDLMENEVADDLMLILLRYPSVVEQSYLTYEPHHLVMYVRNLSVVINKLLYERKIITNQNRAEAETNLALCMASRQVLRNCFNLLGIPPLKQM